MLSHKLFLFCISSGIILFSVYHGTEGILCWQCNSFNDLGCADPFDNTSFPIADCNAQKNLRENLKGLNATMCRKLVQKIEGKWRYIRECAFLGEPGIQGDERYCKRYTGTFDLYTEDCLCRGKDGCNGADRRGRGGDEMVIIASTLLFALGLKFKLI